MQSTAARKRKQVPEGYLIVNRPSQEETCRGGDYSRPHYPR